MDKLGIVDNGLKMLLVFKILLQWPSIVANAHLSLGKVVYHIINY